MKESLLDTILIMKRVFSAFFVQTVAQSGLGGRTHWATERQLTVPGHAR